jgi:tRNA nucleotidyltransferase (CCA-adding enzyme)
MGECACHHQVFVYDHHVMKRPDIAATELIVDDVGSVTTLVVELLKAQAVAVTDAEATLLAVGIHADTGRGGGVG